MRKMLLVFLAVLLFGVAAPVTGAIAQCGPDLEKAVEVRAAAMAPAPVNLMGQEHPGLAGQPAGNKFIGKILWQPLKLAAGAGNFLDNLFKGNLGAAVKQAVTAPVNYPVSVMADGVTLATGDMKVYGSPGNEIIQLK